MKNRSNRSQSRTSSDEADASESERRQSRTTAKTETRQVSGQAVSTAGAAVDASVQRVPQAEAPQEPGLGPVASARAEAIRERFAERPAAVPDDNSRQNLASLQRSTQTQHDTAPAGEADVPKSVRDVISSAGRSLDTSIQRAMEDRMGDSLGDVRIHTGPKAANACEEINAKAFTVGNHIAFNSGEYDPESPKGQFLLAHELAHVRQQTGTAISMMPAADADLEIDPDPRLEREADEVATQALSGEEPLVVNRRGVEAQIQRVPQDKVFEAMALFGAENKSGEISEFREDQNANRLAYLHGVAQNVIERESKESELSAKQELKNADSKGARQVAQRGPSEADIKTQIEDLKSSIDSDLSDVALTDDQRLMLRGSAETSAWDEASWGLVKSILSATTIPALISLINVSSSAAGYDLDSRGKQTISQLRQGNIESLDDLKDIWRQTNGTLEERAEQIEQEIREGVWYDGAESPDSVPDIEEVK